MIKKERTVLYSELILLSNKITHIQSKLDSAASNSDITYKQIPQNRRNNKKSYLLNRKRKLLRISASNVYKSIYYIEKAIEHIKEINGYE